MCTCPLKKCKKNPNACLPMPILLILLLPYFGDSPSRSYGSHHSTPWCYSTSHCPNVHTSLQVAGLAQQRMSMCASRSRNQDQDSCTLALGHGSTKLSILGPPLYDTWHGQQLLLHQKTQTTNEWIAKNWQIIIRTLMKLGKSMVDASLLLHA